MTRDQTQQALRQLPGKWAIALLGLIVLYALAQPALNSRLGWNLPSLARLIGEPDLKKAAADDPPKETKPQPPVAQRPTEAKANSGDSTLLYGILKETDRDRYMSVEGLQYNPGSEEGHRLKHLERHLNDIPDRPGKHGVFDGEMKDALKWIDDAYARGKRGAKGVRKTQEDNRTIYEAPFSQPIGYIGGRDGKRDGNPSAKRLRLVVEGNKFITAFPF